MENKAVNDVQNQEFSNMETEINPCQTSGIDEKNIKLSKDCLETEEIKLNKNNGTEESAENGGSVTSPSEIPDLLNNGFLTAKSPCLANETAVTVGNGDVSSVIVDQINSLAALTQQTISAAEELAKSCKQSPETNAITKKSHDVAPIECSDYDEQTMAALLQEAVQDEIVLTEDCATGEKSETDLFIAAIDEFSKGGGIPASLPDLQQDESARLKAISKGEALHKFFQNLDDQLDKAFQEGNASSQEQSDEAIMHKAQENSNGKDTVHVEAGAVLPENNALNSEC